MTTIKSRPHDSNVPAAASAAPETPSGAPAASSERVLAELAAMLRETIGEAWADDIAIGPETSFSRELELESIEFVTLAEKLQQRYGRKVDFAGWLGGMELDRIINLRVGQVVEFIERCLSSNTTT